MVKNFSAIAKVCEIISKYLIYISVALTPVLFFPWTTDALDFNKQAVFIFLIFLSLFFWMIKVLISGTFTASLNKNHFAFIFFILAYLASTIFSLNKNGSFWGWPAVTSESLLTIIGFAVLYFLITSVFSKKEILNSIAVFLSASLVAVIIGILHLLGLFVIPLSFAKSASFNTIGMVGSLGFFTAVFFPLLVVLATRSSGWIRVVSFAGIVLSAILFILINYSTVWWMVLASSALIMLFLSLKREIFDLRWLSLPMFFLVLALFFLLLQPQISFKDRAIEVYLNQSATFDITLKTLKDRPLLGSGPGTFVYDFSKYKDATFNQSSLWNLKFDGGVSKVLTLLATTGVLGISAFFILIAFIFFSGIKFFSSISMSQEKKNDNFFWVILSGGILAAIIAETVGYFLANSNFSLDFLFFFLIACFVGLTDQNRKEYELAPSSLVTLGTTFAFTVIFIFGFGLLILEGQRYIAEINYSKAQTALAAGNIDNGITKLTKAANMNQNSDAYLTELSQVYLSKINVQLNNKDLSDSEKSASVELLAKNAVNASLAATKINPGNVSNWSVNGYVYLNLIGLGVTGMDELALKSYDQAISLDPANPYYPTQKGMVYLTNASVLSKDKTTEINQNLENAKAQFEKAIQLKSDYASPRYQIAMVYQAQGKTNEEFKALEETKKYSPNDVGLAFQIGLLYYQKADYTNAKAEFERTIALNSDYANALYFLSLTYYKLGQNDKAIQAMQRVVDLNPDNADIKTALENLKAGKAPVASLETPAETPIEEAKTETTKK